MPRRRLTDPDAPLFPDQPPRQRPAHVQATLAQCAICKAPTSAVGGDLAPLCTRCVQNPCDALDFLEALTVECEERLAKVWVPLEKIIARASEAEQLRYHELWNKRAAAVGNAEEIERLDQGVWLARSTDYRKKAPGLARILDAEAGQREGIEMQHAIIYRKLTQIREAQHALLTLHRRTPAVKDWRVSQALAERRSKIPHFNRPSLLPVETAA